MKSLPSECAFSSPPATWHGDILSWPLKVFALVIKWEWAVPSSWSVESSTSSLGRSVVPFRREPACSWGSDWKKLYGNWTRSLWLVGVPVLPSIVKHKLEPTNTCRELIPPLGNRVVLACSTGVLRACLDVSAGVDRAPAGSEDNWDLISCVTGAGHPTSLFLSLLTRPVSD